MSRERLKPEEFTPRFLERTPEQLAEDKQLQQELARAHSSRVVKPTPEQRQLFRAGYEEQHRRNNLAVLLKNKKLAPDIKERIEREIDQELQLLAQALHDQGRFAEAARMEPTAELASYYEQLHAAVERDDAEACDCPAPASAEHGQHPVNHHATVYSRRHKKFMPVALCSACGHMNVRELPHHLQERAERQRRAHEGSAKKKR